MRTEFMVKLQANLPAIAYGLRDRRFIKNFSQIATPLYNLLKKDINYEWTEERQQVFQQLKNRLISASLLVYPDFDKSFILFTDTSLAALGAVIEQMGEDRY